MIVSAPGVLRQARVRSHLKRSAGENRDRLGLHLHNTEQADDLDTSLSHSVVRNISDERSRGPRGFNIRPFAQVSTSPGFYQQRHDGVMAYQTEYPSSRNESARKVVQTSVTIPPTMIWLLFAAYKETGLVQRWLWWNAVAGDDTLIASLNSSLSHALTSPCLCTRGTRVRLGYMSKMA